MEVEIVLAAVIAAAPPTAMAALAWHKGRENAASIGQKNGHGTLQDAVGTLLTWSQDHTHLDEARHTELVGRIEDLERNK